MRFFARRIAFYVFAVWVALTLNFLLPRLMPGDRARSGSGPLAQRSAERVKTRYFLTARL